MKRIVVKSKWALVFAIAGLLASGQVIADKPSWAGGGKGEKSEQKGKSANSKGGQRDVGGPAVKMREHFGEGQRTAVRNYYNEEFSHGRCPPGLAKKHNGCMPPGQAKKWTVGRPLPRDVIYYHVPPALVGQFGQPPSGYRYVRVASDILLIAVGTGMVIDAIRDLGRA
jgi:Ni/Co efflux regulator RcnB